LCDLEPRLLHDVPGAAKAMSLSRSSIFVLMQRGELPSLMIAGRRLIAHDDLIELVHRLKEKRAVGITTSPAALETVADATTAIP
jgi:predicted DNA-binding transcriptional regulator AlpA